MTYDIPDLIDSYKRQLRVERLSRSTVDTYARSLNMFVQWLRNRGTDPTTDKLTSDNIIDWFIYLDDNYKPATYLIRYKSLKSFCTWLMSEYDGEILPEHPMSKLKQPRVPANPIPIVSQKEIKTLIKACKKKSQPFVACRNEAIIRILYDTGIRVSELINLTVKDIVSKQDTLIIHGKGEKVRVVHYNDKTGIVLDRYLRMRKKHKHSKSKSLWISSSGGLTTNGIQKMLTRLCESVNLPHIHPHMLRHTMIHDYLDNGGQERSLKRITGHSSSYTLSLYAEALAEERAIKEHKRLALGDRI